MDMSLETQYRFVIKGDLKTDKEAWVELMNQLCLDGWTPGDGGAGEVEGTYFSV